MWHFDLSPASGCPPPPSIQSHSPIYVSQSQHLSLIAIGQKKASSHSLVIRDTRNRDREMSSGQSHLFNILATGAIDRTWGQPQVTLSLFAHSIYLKNSITVVALRYSLVSSLPKYFSVTFRHRKCLFAFCHDSRETDFGLRRADLDKKTIWKSGRHFALEWKMYFRFNPILFSESEPYSWWGTFFRTNRRGQI